MYHTVAQMWHVLHVHTQEWNHKQVKNKKKPTHTYTPDNTNTTETDTHPHTQASLLQFPRSVISSVSVNPGWILRFNIKDDVQQSHRLKLELQLFIQTAANTNICFVFCVHQPQAEWSSSSFSAQANKKTHEWRALSAVYPEVFHMFWNTHFVNDEDNKTETPMNIMQTNKHIMNWYIFSKYVKNRNMSLIKIDAMALDWVPLNTCT